MGKLLVGPLLFSLPASSDASRPVSHPIDRPMFDSCRSPKKKPIQEVGVRMQRHFHFLISPCPCHLSTSTSCPPHGRAAHQLKPRSRSHISFSETLSEIVCIACFTLAMSAKVTLRLHAGGELLIIRRYGYSVRITRTPCGSVRELLQWWACGRRGRSCPCRVSTRRAMGPRAKKNSQNMCNVSGCETNGQ